MKIDANTRLLCLLGKPARHSLSPKIHNLACDMNGINCSYMVFEPDNLEATVKGLKSMSVVGFNVTMPYKTEIIKYLDECDEIARNNNAVNTVKLEDGKLKGYNTDGDGLLKSIEKELALKKEPKVLLLGGGGAARAIIVSLLWHTDAQVSVYTRREVEFLSKIRDKKLRYNLMKNRDLYFYDIKNADIIINATSVGMHSEDSLVPAELLDKKQTVVDIIYSPLYTKLYRDAKKVGCNVYNGYDMLINQANLAFKIWFGKEFDVNFIKNNILK